MALFFFPGVGVADEEVAQGKWTCCLRGGDQAVDGLCFSGERVGGRARPGGGQRDGARGVGVGAVKSGAPPVWRRVVVTDELGVGVGVHALMPGHSLVGGDGVWRPVSPVPFVAGRSQCDGDVVSEQVDDVSLCRIRDRDDRGNVLVRIRDVWRLLVDSSAIRVDGGSGMTQNLLS